jgi:hypothetical protein
MDTTDVAVIGAGPYGLSATAHLRRAGVETRTLGEPMSFWRSMPKGMLLRSNLTATCIAEHQGSLSLETYRRQLGLLSEKPVSLHRFIEYGEWVQRCVAPDVETRSVDRVERPDGRFVLTLADGEHLQARRVVVAGGIAPFAWRPTRFDHLPPDLASHTSGHDDLSSFSGRRVLVVGGGQSALESAALMRESGAEVEVIVRADHINWLHGGRYHRKLGRAVPLFYAPHDVGPLGLSRLIGFTDGYRRIPHPVQDPITRRSIRPAGAAWLLPRLEDVPIRLGETLRTATVSGRGVEVQLSGGGSRVVDHVMFGTGYRVDVRRYPFLAPELAEGIHETNGYPILGPGLESSIPRMHFIGAPAAWSFGPTMRFVSGSWYAGKQVARAARGGRQPLRGRGRFTPSRDRTGPGAAIVSGGGVLE